MPGTGIVDGERGQVALTVGKVESGMAVVLTDDLQMLELPSSFLPDLSTGSVVRMRLEPAKDLEAHRHGEFAELQRKILQDFGKAPDAGKIAVCLAVSEKTHTTLTLRWPPWSELFPENHATVHATDTFLNGQRMSNPAILPSENALRLTGLEPGQTYTIQLVFRTSAGRFETNTVATETAGLHDLSCLRVFVDAGVDASVFAALDELRVPITMTIEEEKTTHAVSARTGSELAAGHDSGELLRLCQQLNIPIVTEQWVHACKIAGRMQSVSHFYCK